MNRPHMKTAVLNLEELNRAARSPLAVTPSVTLMAGDTPGRVIQIENGGELVIGRDAACDLPLDLPLLSWRHCRLRREGDRVILTDLESTNGTFVNGHPVSRQALADGDRIFLADAYVLKFRLVDETDLLVNRMLYRKSTRDDLTGLCNRPYFQEHLRREYLFHRRAELPLSVLFFDVDGFKTINDDLGHLRGDQVLRAFARRIRHQVREEDFLARYGGEEFVLLLRNTVHVHAMTKAESLRLSIAEYPLSIDDRTIPVTASFGVATMDDGEMYDTPEALLARADARMYEAKSGGRNRVSGRTP